MFKNLGNFGYKRTALQAVGFYLVFFIIGVMLGAISNLVLSLIMGLPMNTPEEGAATIEKTKPYIITIIAFYCVLLSFLVAKAKNILPQARTIFAILFTFILAFLGGSLFGLIPVTILTTVDGKDNVQ